MAAYAGIDLHSRDNLLGVIDDEDRRLYQKRLPNRLEPVLEALSPYREELVGVVVESTYNWYWLVDGLMEHGYEVHLANPSGNKQYEGLKYTDDRWDSFWMAHMLRLGILKEGYIYPKEERPLRDLLRRRGLLVSQRTSQIMSFQSAVSRHLGMQMPSDTIKKLKEGEGEDLFGQNYVGLSAETSLRVIRFLGEQILRLEKEAKPQVKLRDEFKYLLTVPGIGDILGMTIMLELGDIHRFPTVGDYSSYCRCVKSERRSANKRKGENNKKNGNRYLAWAYVEAAHFARRACPKAKRFFQRKEAKKGSIVARKALGHKLARASYYIIRDQVPYDATKLFG
jgi:transposase